MYDYQTCRSGQHAAGFLQNWQGTVLVDDYSGYKHLFWNGVTELRCWVHAPSNAHLNGAFNSIELFVFN